MPLGLMFIPGGNTTEIDALIAANLLGLCDYELKAYMVGSVRLSVLFYAKVGNFRDVVQPAVAGFSASSEQPNSGRDFLTL